jgi:dipeptidyl aminopeptidase/acylaminoacyl peptidase
LWLIAVIALVVLALAAGAAVVGSLQARWPDFLGQTRGLIAYSSDGDIYLGDPISGSTLAIVTGPDLDSRPVFSPDGSRIAVLRGDPDAGRAVVIVMRFDGSDQRIITPELRAEPREPHPGAGPADPWAVHQPFADLLVAWTPDSAFVVAADRSGTLTVFDAAGVDEPYDPTSVLPESASLVGLGFLQPPAGERIVYGICGGLSAIDADGTDLTMLFQRSWPRVGPNTCSTPREVVWSPDGSRIAFSDRVEADPFVQRAYIVDATGGDPQRLVPDPVLPAGQVDVGQVTEHAPAWSPDGARIALYRVWPFDRRIRSSWITIVDIESGLERELDATRQSHIRIEGWSWSPDGRSILALMRAGTRPLVVDIASGRAAELPWEPDSPPSWQPVPTE